MFLYEKDILPTYEDKENINGVFGHLRFQKNSNDFWKNMCYLLSSENLTKIIKIFYI